MKLCAVIPAAGRGTRLGLPGPKILTHLSKDETIWSILYKKLTPRVDHIHLILSPEGQDTFTRALPRLPPNISIGRQNEPRGMGDAIFSGYNIWRSYDAILIVWGDQVFVSERTLDHTIAAAQDPRHCICLPLTRISRPYVEYVFEGGRLAKVCQSREGDLCAPNGLGDVGTFLLGTKDISTAWSAYLIQQAAGSQTGEINFLPFLPFLSFRGWTIKAIDVSDPTEARGINTQDDLAFFQELYSKLP